MPGSATTIGTQDDRSTSMPISAARPIEPTSGAESKVEQTL